MFPLNAWYVVARPDEIGRDKPLGRRICNQPIAFFRNAEGVIGAAEDFCPHRGVPLSLGFVRDGHLVCGYHGLAMAATAARSACPASA